MSLRGVLLVNLGTPESPGLWDVWRYLNEFLTDSRVIDLPWWQRQLLVRGLIVPRRVWGSAKLYRQLWTSEGSPLMVNSQRLVSKLQAKLQGEWQVELAMRYQAPSIKRGLAKLKNCHEIVILPLFPQYASATSGSVIEKAMEEIQSWPAIPSLRFVGPYYDHPAVIAALAKQADGFNLSHYDKVLFSFHGLPVKEKTAAAYATQCQTTAKLLAKELHLNPDRWELAFQSRLGKDPWLEPYATDSLKKMVQEGVKNLLVFSPAFVADCLETLQEIGVEYAVEFRHLGGETLNLVPCLNDSPAWVDALEKIIIKN